MNTTVVLPSTFFLTLLLAIGLFFFIRASVKDRTETALWTLPNSEQDILKAATQHLEQRAYRFQSVDRDRNQVLFTGVVGASLGLAIFLSALAGICALCLGLVLAVQFPQLGYSGNLLILLAPLAGWFYYQKAQRPEQVILSVQKANLPQQTCLRVTAHRDELAAFQTVFNKPSASS